MSDSIELTKRELIQQEALATSVTYYRCGLGISMGVGKTLIGLRHMEKEFPNLKTRFLVVAPKVSIFESWKDDAKKFGLEYLLDHIDFTTYISLSKKTRDYDVIYLDECHSLLFTHDYYLATYTGKILGLSGTPPRYKNSEKGEMVNRYCPIVYTYITDDAVEDKILNDYKILVHRIPLSNAKTHRVETKKGGFFMTSESQNYDYWCGRLNSAANAAQIKIFRIMRMQALMQFRSKEKYARELLNMMDDKCLVFCNTTDQADRISVNSYHSKNSMSEDTLVAFKEGKIDELTCVQQLNEGVNIPNLKYGIILHAYSNERKASQRIGRLLRLNPDDKAIIHILMYGNTVDEGWVQDALRDLDSEKIVYTDPFC